MRTPILSPHDLLTAAAVCQQALTPALCEDWSLKAGDLEWDCRRTLDHICDTLTLYAVHLASRAQERLPFARNGDPARSVADLLTVMQALAAVLAEVARAAPPGTRAFHPAGRADVTGFIAMSCVEMLIHTADILQGLGRPFRPPDDLTARVLARLFPWAPVGDVWACLRWANGRLALPDHLRLGADWYWHCAPLEEWDGTVKKRTAPPAWS